jgi:hypothetical protein
MVRTLGVLSLSAALALPAAAAELPVVINLPSDLAKLTNGAAGAKATQEAAQPPKVINYPSGSDGTQPAANVPRPARPIYVVFYPTANNIWSPPLVTNYASPATSYYSSSFFGAGPWAIYAPFYPGYGRFCGFGY